MYNTVLPSQEMTRPLAISPSPLVVVSVAIVAVGIAVNDGFDSVVRSVPALVLTAAGLVGVTSTVSTRSVDRLRRSTRRWWLVAFASVLPYGLVTAPSSEAAVSVGEAISGPIPGFVLEAVAGAALLCAVAVTAVFGVASYGLHPGRPTPEERILNDDGERRASDRDSDLR